MAPDMRPSHRHPAVEVVLASEAFARAMVALRADHDRIVAENIALQSIAAPYRGEAEKARAFAALLGESGLSGIGIDREGNVLAVKPGASPAGKLVALVSHLDTVFEAGTDLSVRRDGTRIIAPGIADNTRGLAVQLGLIRAMRQSGLEHRDDILFVGSVGEEGLGDLRGVKHLLGAGDYRDRIDRFIALDGSRPDAIVTQAVGSKRYALRFSGPGGHSYAAFGTVNPAYALARAASEIAALAVPDGTTYGVGLIGGGTSINAIPTEAWCQIDMRSSDPAELARLEERVLAIASEAAVRENGTRSTAAGAISVAFDKLGDRPSGRMPDETDIVRIAAAALAAHGWTPRLVASSTDANVPISLGIPAVAVASGIGGRAHSRDEYLDAEPEASLRQMGMALATLIAVAGSV